MADIDGTAKPRRSQAGVEREQADTIAHILPLVPELKPLVLELAGLLADLTLVSHTSAVSLEQMRRSGSEDSIGGRRPGGGDRESWPARGTVDERGAWEDSYLRRTPAWYRGQLVHVLRFLGDERGTVDRAYRELADLVEDCRETLSAWRHVRVPEGQPPETRADPRWKRYVATCGKDSGVLADKYKVTRRYINKVRHWYWSARPAPVEPVRAPLTAEEVGDELRRAQRLAQ